MTSSQPCNAQAGLELPCSLAQLKRIIMETVAASKKMNGEVA